MWQSSSETESIYIQLNKNQSGYKDKKSVLKVVGSWKQNFLFHFWGKYNYKNQKNKPWSLKAESSIGTLVYIRNWKKAVDASLSSNPYVTQKSCP